MNPLYHHFISENKFTVLRDNSVNEILFYHVVTDRPMQVGQHIFFDGENHNGVYNRVMSKLPIVNDIYKCPKKYDAEKLERHTRVALRELALEKVRQREYPERPSRMSCLYVSESIEESEKWAELFIALGRPTYSIVELSVTGKAFAGDANNCFDATLDENENLLLAERYWKNLPNLQDEPPIKEILISGDIEVKSIIKEIHKNI